MGKKAAVKSGRSTAIEPRGGLYSTAVGCKGGAPERLADAAGAPG
ncbi:MAG TPA: hypothetical protein VE685_23300 [Thermoanaerobaculia bacterium]|nr:hypothetical protein [Thermoanaerobaculia bacterium]